MHDRPAGTLSAPAVAHNQDSDSWRSEVNAILLRLGPPSHHASFVATPSECSLVTAPCHAALGNATRSDCRGWSPSPTVPRTVIASELRALDDNEMATVPFHPAERTVVEQNNRREPQAEFRSPIHPSADGAIPRGAVVDASGVSVDTVMRTVYAASASVAAALGTGLEPPAFAAFLAHELRLRGLSVAENMAVAASYMGMVLHDAFRIDLVVDSRVIVEIAATQRTVGEHESRLRYFMACTGACAAMVLPVCYAGPAADVILLRDDTIN